MNTPAEKSGLQIGFVNFDSSSQHPPPIHTHMGAGKVTQSADSRASTNGNVAALALHMGLPC